MLHVSMTVYLQITTNLYSPMARDNMVTSQQIAIQDNAVLSLLILLTAMAAIKRCSASNVFRTHMGKLMNAIQNAEVLHITMELYAKGVISKDTRDRSRLSGLIPSERNEILLTAVEDAIGTQDQVLDIFLNILDDYTPSDIAQEMYSKLCEAIKSIT